MPTIRLTPSTYYVSNSTYLKGTNINNMYTDTDSTTYATWTNSQSGTTSYYLYIRGFNFDDVPSDATINSFTVKFKAYESGVSTSTSYRPYLCNNTTTITCSCNAVTTSTQTLSFTGVTADWETIKGYGANFGIRLNCRRNNKNTTAYMYVYGAEILVDYSIKTYDVNLSCQNGTIEPSGTQVVNEGASFSFTCKGNDDTVLKSATINGNPVTLTETKTSGLTDGVSLFHLDDSNWTDELGNGTLTTTASINTSSKKFGNGSIYLSGSNYVQISLPQDYSPITIECWFNVTSANASGSYPTLFSTSASSNAGGTYMHIDDGSYSTYPVCCSNQSSSSNNTGGYGSTVITRNTWHHFAYCRNGSTHYFFVDGKLEYTVTQSSPCSAQNIYFGGLRGASSMVSGCYMTGYIDEILVSSTCKWTSAFTPPTSNYVNKEETIYSYTIPSVDEDKNIVIVFGEDSKIVFYVKENGSWVEKTLRLFNKINGQWVEQTDIASALNPAINYVKAN